ncbi:MAG: hypothetical protein GY730_08045 [bacterium]|nr:hypothetical protein [bacterium]
MHLDLKKITKEQSIDTGMAMVLLCLIFGNIFVRIQFLNIIAIVILVVTMSVPAVFKPAAIGWFGLSHFLGSIVSKILLSSIYFLVVTPVGLLRSCFRKDSMGLRCFKKETCSVFKTRNHTFSRLDLEDPY